MNEPTMECLTRRLERVERENRRLKRAGVAALAGLDRPVGLLPRGNQLAETQRDGESQENRQADYLSPEGKSQPLSFATCINAMQNTLRKNPTGQGNR